jgi:hypothetical protein
MVLVQQRRQYNWLYCPSSFAEQARRFGDGVIDLPFYRRSTRRSIVGQRELAARTIFQITVLVQVSLLKH